MNFLSAVQTPSGPPPPELQFSLLSRLALLIAQIQPALAPGADLDAQPLRVLDAALTDFLQTLAPARPMAGGLAPAAMRRVVRFIDDNIDAALTVAALATIAGLSKSHFYRTFEASTGVSPHMFVMQRRVERAQSLISQTGEPLAEIALACGLSDQAHLTRLFRRFAGVTPGQWRRHVTASATHPLSTSQPVAASV